MLRTVFSCYVNSTDFYHFCPVYYDVPVMYMNFSELTYNCHIF